MRKRRRSLLDRELQQAVETVMDATATTPTGDSTSTIETAAPPASRRRRGGRGRVSSGDLRILRSNGGVDRKGRQGMASDDQLAPDMNGEDVDGTDLVLWYTGPCSTRPAHVVRSGHSVGPSPAPSPTGRRRWDF